MDLNQFHLIGRLVRDVEIKSTPGGVTVAKITIANNQKIKKNGQWVDVASYFDIVLFGQNANNLAQYLIKGKQIAVSGALRQDRWTDNAGNNRTKISLIASQLQLLGGMQTQNQNRNSYSQNTGAAYQQQQQQPDTLNSLQNAGLVDDEPPLWEECF